MTSANVSIEWVCTNPHDITITGSIEGEKTFSHCYHYEEVSPIIEELTKISQGYIIPLSSMETLFAHHYLGFTGIVNMLYGLTMAYKKLSLFHEGHVVDDSYIVDVGCKDTFSITHG